VHTVQMWQVARKDTCARS